MRDAVDAVEVGHLARRAHNVVPVHAHLFDGFARLGHVVPHGHAQHVEVVAVKLVVDGLDVGHLAPARAAPACPEVDQRVFAPAHIVRERHRRAVERSVDDGEVLHGAARRCGLERLVFGRQPRYRAVVADVVARAGHGFFKFVGRLHFRRPVPHGPRAERIVVLPDYGPRNVGQAGQQRAVQVVADGLLFGKAQRVELPDAVVGGLVLGVGPVHGLAHLAHFGVHGRARRRPLLKVDHDVARLQDDVDAHPPYLNVADGIARYGPLEAEAAAAHHGAVDTRARVVVVEVDGGVVERRVGSLAADGVARFGHAHGQCACDGNADCELCFHSDELNV